MAKQSLIIKTNRRNKAVKHRLELGLEPLPGQRVKSYNRCTKCGKNRGVIRKFTLCRICIREFAQKGEIMGLRKSSW
ncbi:MAG: 30S ribosomal protein S14 [Patescibacteria group bacterium]